jgi:hypothetical protein
MFDFGEFSISKREILIGIAIIAIMIVLGLIIHGSIEDSLMLKHQEYNLALQIDNNKDMFEYAMETNIGNSFVYGTLKCLDPVTYDEIGGQYSYVEKVKERYTMHTRTVTETYYVNGKAQTRTRTEHYWTWDRVDSWSKHCNRISFLDVEFKYGEIDFPGSSYITTIKESSDIRYKYYGSPIECSGTIYSDLRNNTINKTEFHRNMNIQETLKRYTSSGELVIFWILWILFILFAVFGFVYIDNHWLEDKHFRRR